MKLGWESKGWQDYIYWQQKDKKILKRINLLIKDTLRNPTSGLGKPERLKYQKSSCYSRRINDEHRLVYVVTDTEIIILACRYHYKK